MEATAGVDAPVDEDFPTRLDRCAARLGHKRFQSRLRERYYTQVAESLLSQALELVEAEDFVPEPIRSLAALGQCANPIVSFNIEPISSLLLGRPAGPVRIVSYKTRGRPTQRWQEPGDRFQRLVYHPHGLATADPIMTASQYETHHETLAFQLAIHAAFGNTLAIVGMSLDDEYLRQQIENYRASLETVYWFNSAFPARLAVWANRNSITTVKTEWTAFWDLWREDMHVNIERHDFCGAWYLAVQQAAAEASGGSLGDLKRIVADQPWADDPAARGLRELAEELSDAGERLGEPGRERLINGQHPREIELAVRERMQNANIPTPMISDMYDPGAP
jgi:hypothetical protein